MSGVSTVAIKDGHEGIRQVHHHQQDPASLQRMADLSPYRGISVPAEPVGGDRGGDLERVAGWCDHVEARTTGESPEEQCGLEGGELTLESGGSPTSTITTNSVREAKHNAKMLGPVIYDEGIVDTTCQNGSETKRSPSPPIVLNKGYIYEGDRMDVDETGDRMDLDETGDGGGKGSGTGNLRDSGGRRVGGDHRVFR